MPGTPQLLCRSQPGGAAADNSCALARVLLGRLRMDPTFVPCAFHNAAFDQLDGDGRLVDAQHAGGFARRRADAPSELRKIVGGMQAANRALQAAVVDEVVPVG